jgi:hypothetical protein
MRKCFIALPTLGAIAILVLMVEPAPNQGMPAADTFTPGVGDMMNTFVQPRHAKLGLALREENWALAFYLQRELRQAFGNIARVHPKWRNLSLDQMIDTVTSKPLRDLEAAIKERDPKRFADSYAEMTEACNACHAAVNYAFIVIKAPDASQFANQDFRAPK